MVVAIILDGVDGVGKSSVRHRISSYNPNYFILERFTPSIWAYGRYFERKNLDSGSLEILESKLSEAFEVKPIFLYCHLDELYKRYGRGRHVLNLSKNDLRGLQNLMISFVDSRSKIPWFKLDNTEKSSDETFEIIREEFGL